jgi:hypothetical protein
MQSFCTPTREPGQLALDQHRSSGSYVRLRSFASTLATISSHQHLLTRRLVGQSLDPPAITLVGIDKVPLEAPGAAGAASPGQARLIGQFDEAMSRIGRWCGTSRQGPRP